MSKRTPGPWKMCGEERHGCSCGLVYAANADVAIATTYLVEDGFEAPMPELEERKGNARLIAAAPELLASVEMLMEYAEMHLGLCDDNDPACEAVLAVAKSVMAKAKGE